jgi:DNA-directed RNA polymerase specialized sigma24 family protein
VSRKRAAPDAGLGLIKEALRLFEKAPPSADHAEARLRYATMFLFEAKEQHEPILAALTRALEIAEGAGADALIARTVVWLAADAFFRGQIEEGFALLHRGRAVAEAAGYTWWRQAQAQLDAAQPATAAAPALRAATAAADGHAPLQAHIRTVAERARITLHTPAPTTPAEAPTPFGLTSRELAVLRLLAVGKTNAQIGAEPAALPGWLATTTRRECGRVLRAPGGPHATGHLPDAETFPNERAAPTDHELLEAEWHAALRDAFTVLPPPCQQLIAILTADPLVPYAEISARLGIAVGSIGPTHRRCLDTLRRHLDIAALITGETQTAQGEIPHQTSAH